LQYQSFFEHSLLLLLLVYKIAPFSGTF